MCKFVSTFDKLSDAILHAAKAPSPITFMLLGKVILERLAQQLKACFSICSMLFGKIMLSRLRQYLKAPSFIRTTQVSSKFILDNFPQD